MKALVRCVQRRPTFYRKLFNVREIDFTRSFTSLYWPAIEDDVDFILDGRYMPPATKRLIVTTTTQLIVAIVRFCLEDVGGDTLLDERVNPFWNIIHESLYAAIQHHPINRYTRG